MPGTLFVVATPIGNLEDITLRAIRVLREVDLIAAEDTRRTARLLARHAINTRTISFHAHNSKTRTPQLIARLSRGHSLALVTDAGTPGISDPGVELVHSCIEAGVPVEPVPGVSASLAAAAASGFDLIPMTIFGFPPRGSNDRYVWWKAVVATSGTVTIFEAPHRVIATLKTAASFLGNRPIMIGRELTKIHQEFLRGTAGELVERLGAKPRGEFTIVIGPLTNRTANDHTPSDEIVSSVFGEITKNGALTRREAIAGTARRLGIPSKDVYAAVERHKNR